jgi:hypothetical protein
MQLGGKVPDGDEAARRRGGALVIAEEWDRRERRVPEIGRRAATLQLWPSSVDVTKRCRTKLLGVPA